MTINNSLYIGVSGLLAHGDAISVVGDNIANVSTVGFKRSRASFSDLLGGELANQRLGGGVRLGGTQTMHDQGTIMQSGNPMDVAISGGGMFVVRGNHGGRDGQFYTRDGRFQLDNQGLVVDQHGMRVQGFTIGANGQKSVTPGDLALAGRSSPPVASTTANLALNLDSNSPIGAFDPTNPQASSAYATSATVKDSLGNNHAVQMFFTQVSPGAWEWHAMADGGELGGTAGQLTEIATGGMTFDTSGNLLTQTTTASSASFNNAAPNQAIAFDFTDTTQAAGASTVNSVDVDGRSAGTLQDIQINADGTIRGTFDNGDSFDIAQLALADFASDEGLERVGDGMMIETAASGQPLIDAPGTGARGSLVSGALEGSNVDLGTELVTLIAYQRAFQANSKTVSTADEMLADVTNLKR
jgi:flagellar hook protein FlgE